MTSNDYMRPQSALSGGVESKSDTLSNISHVSVYGTDRIGRGSMLFSGPDGLRPYRMRVEDEHRYVGIGTMSPEGTSEANYLWNSPESTPHHRPRTAMVGEIGWGVTFAPDLRSLQSGKQIKLQDFRQDCEQRATHKHFNQDQDVWYSGPRDSATPLHDPYWIGSPSSANRNSRRPVTAYTPKPYQTQERRQPTDQSSTASSYSR
ncbi:uncharacterized protein LOC135497345 [Lineus longissimus]|uniref:uncharacterized protein LOC135497345 n=1 Tax=Lineus longissimus TaxID=88925 RepID=UPI002B4DC1F5